MHGKQKYREAGYSNTPPPPPPPPLLLKLPWRESALSHTNGYSIAEILLVFGIIASVLIGVWAMYTMLSEDQDVKNVIAEIQVIREAAVQWKVANGNKWRGDWDPDNPYAPTNEVRLDRIAPYANKAIKYTSETHDAGTPYEYTDVQGFNIFGGTVSIGPYLDNARLSYALLKDMRICTRVLSHFGEIEQSEARNPWHNPSDPNNHQSATVTEITIPLGKTIYGYVGTNNPYIAGCRKNHRAPNDPSYVLSLLID